MKSGLLGLIQSYDERQLAYIAHLEAALVAERAKTAELTGLLMSATHANEKKTLELIMSGHYDDLRKDPTP